MEFVSPCLLPGQVWQSVEEDLAYILDEIGEELDSVMLSGFFDFTYPALDED